MQIYKKKLIEKEKRSEKSERFQVINKKF